MKTIDTDLTILEGARHVWRITFKNEAGEVCDPANYHVYGAADCLGQTPRPMLVAYEGEVCVVQMPGLPCVENTWNFQIMAKEVSSRVEWLLAAASVNLIARAAGAGVAIDPGVQEYQATLNRETHEIVVVVGDNMGSVAANEKLAREHAAAAQDARAGAEGAESKAKASEEAAASSEGNAKASEEAAATSESKAKASEEAAATSETNAKASEEAAATSETNAKASEEAAATSETNAKASEEAAATSKTNAKASEEAAASSESKAKASEEAAATSETNAKASEEAAASSESKAKGSEEAAATSETNAKASEEAAKAHADVAEESKNYVVEKEAAINGHMGNQSIHLTAQQAKTLARIERDFPEVTPDSPGTPEPVLPTGALSHERVSEHFAMHAQPGTAQAPPAVYVSRIPWARMNEEGTAWENNASAVNETIFQASRKFMDNAGLVHECSTDTREGQDDYVGKLWPFYWQHGNYVTDGYGVKHLTAIKGQEIDGVVFDPVQPVCAFGPSFYFFCCLERWQNPETGMWTTHDGTAEGTPLFQLIGISARAWADLDDGRRAELAAHGVTEADFHLWAECHTWDADTTQEVPRPYWCHSAYCGGAEQHEDGTITFESKPGLPLYNNLSHNALNNLYGNLPGFGGSACVNAFGVIFDIVKNATKNSQSIHAGMASNNNSAVLSTLSTASADYVFPIASQAHFVPGGTVWLWQSASGSTATTYRRRVSVQIGRIDAIETRTLTLADGTTAESLCLVIDPATVQPFLVRTGATNEEAIAATKELTDAGSYAACFATQGMALSGETDAVIGKHDGSRDSLTNSRHPYRVQGTEYMPGVYMCAADVVACKGDSTTAVTVDGVESVPDSSRYVILQAPRNVTRRTSGSLANYVASGYMPVGLAPAKEGYILNEWISPTGVAYPIANGGTGSGSSNGHGDNLYVGANPAEFLMAGTLTNGAASGSACLSLNSALSAGAWHVGGRD